MKIIYTIQDLFLDQYYIRKGEEIEQFYTKFLIRFKEVVKNLLWIK